MQLSVNSGTVELEMHSGRSFMYTRNRMGPSTVPCGTPEVTGTDVEVSPSSTTVFGPISEKVSYPSMCDGVSSIPLKLI